MNILLILLVALSLAIDAFSLAVSFGFFNINLKKSLIFALIVGIFHFIMPILGLNFATLIEKLIIISYNKLLFLIFLFITIEMVISYFSKESKEYNFNYLNLVLYAFSVSLDSFTIGLGLKGITDYYIIACLIFAIIAFLFTYIGLIIGKLSYQKLGNISKIIGIIIMICLTIRHLIN